MQDAKGRPCHSQILKLYAQHVWISLRYPWVCPSTTDSLGQAAEAGGGGVRIIE